MAISSRCVALAAVGLLCAAPAFAQSTTDNPAPKTQHTQGLPPSLANPSYGPGAEGANARKQQTQGVPAALADPQYGTSWKNNQGSNAATRQ